VLDKADKDTRISWTSRKILSSAEINVPSLAMEIGAFDNPTLRSTDGFEVRYIDHFAPDELRALHARNVRRNFDRLVNVDYVIKGPRMSEHIAEKADLIVANHVIEHICNPVAWLQDIASFSNEGATIFLSVPDQRYTFDLLKQQTDVTDLVGAYERGKEQPDEYDVARMRHLHIRVDAAALWRGEPAPQAPKETAKSYREQLERARCEVQNGYVDTHCSFYTSTSFLHVYRELFRSGYIPWEVELLDDVTPGGNEFHALLRLRRSTGLLAKGRIEQSGSFAEGP
jgi:hypothetical protein